MYLIGESLNVISTKIGKAFKERDPKPIQEEALHQKEMGMDYIDINLGPAKKDGHELMPWVVEVVQDVVPDKPLVRRRERERPHCHRQADPTRLSLPVPCGL